MLNTPLQMILVILAGWIDRWRLAVIDYLKESNRVLREHLELRPDLRPKGPNSTMRAPMRAFLTR